MADIDSQILAERIRDARIRADLTQEQLAEAAGLGDRTVMNKIESGARKVSALELADIAEAVGIRMASFFTDPLPSIVSHRASLSVDAVDAQIDRFLVNLAADVELVDSFAPQELGLRSVDPLPHPQSMAEAEALGVHVRGMLGLSDADPVYDIASKAASLGLLMFARDLGPDTADAGTILLRRGGISVINSHNMVGRRRVAAGHELGHYVVADEYTVDWRVAAQGGDVEPRLDRFARALLLPRQAVEDAWDRWSRQFDLRDAAVQIASHYRMDMATLAKRLVELGILSGEDAGQVRLVRTTRDDIERFGLKVQEELQGTFTPAPFQNAVLKAVVDERISRERALDLLQGTFAGDQLPERRQRRADEIWKFVS